eukprot:16252401-Heterocapsa_arctica.AAC.1
MHLDVGWDIQLASQGSRIARAHPSGHGPLGYPASVNSWLPGAASADRARAHGAAVRFHGARQAICTIFGV